MQENTVIWSELMKQVCFYCSLLCPDVNQLQGVYSFQYFNLAFLKRIAQNTSDRVALLVLCTLIPNQFIDNIFRGYWIQHYMSTCWMIIFQKKKKNTGSSYTTSKQKVMQNYRLLHLLYLKLPFSSIIFLCVLNHCWSVGLRILKMLQTMQNLFTFYWNRLNTFYVFMYHMYLCIHMIEVS